MPKTAWIVAYDATIDEAERKRQEVLRYFEEVFVYFNEPSGEWRLRRESPPFPGDVLTFRGAFERYQRLGVAAYDGRGR